MSTKPWLRDYFTRLADNLCNNHIVSERALSATVELPLPGWGRGRTLLQALDYADRDVHAQYPIRVGTSKPKVDFVLGQEPNRWMLELKKPGDLCSRPKHVEQLHSYLSQEKVALGILFDGDTAFLYLNPEYPAVADACGAISDEEMREIPLLDLKHNPAKAARMIDGATREICDFFRMFRCDGALPPIETLARSLAHEYVTNVRREARRVQRQSDLRVAVNGVLQLPNENVAKALIGVSNSLQALRATPREVLEHWPSVCVETETPAPIARRGRKPRDAQ
jgi:hypothetical protein